MKKQVEKIRKKAYRRGQQDAMKILWLLPMLVLRDEFGFGKKRMLQYASKLNQTMEAYNSDVITLEDIHQVLVDEVGIDLDVIDK